MNKIISKEAAQIVYYLFSSTLLPPLTISTAAVILNTESHYRGYLACPPSQTVVAKDLFPKWLQCIVVAPHAMRYTYGV